MHSDVEPLLSLLPGCKLLFRHDLTKHWGKHCHSCVYCHSVSKKLVTAQYGGSTEEFCSDDCRSKYTMLFCHVSEPLCVYRNRSSIKTMVKMMPHLNVYSLFSLRSRSVTPAAAKGNWSRVFPCSERPNTSVTWLVCYNFAVIRWPRKGRSSKVCFYFLLFYLFFLCCGFDPDVLIKMLCVS